MSAMGDMGDKSAHEFEHGDGRIPSGLRKIIRVMVQKGAKWCKNREHDREFTRMDLRGLPFLYYFFTDFRGGAKSPEQSHFVLGSLLELTGVGWRSVRGRGRRAEGVRLAVYWWRPRSLVVVSGRQRAVAGTAKREAQGAWREAPCGKTGDDGEHGAGDIPLWVKEPCHP